MTYKSDPGPGKYHDEGKSNPCPDCGGSGRKKKFFGGYRECYGCQGTGFKDGVRWKPAEDPYEEMPGDPNCDHVFRTGGHEFEPKKCVKCGYRSNC